MATDDSAPYIKRSCNQSRSSGISWLHPGNVLWRVSCFCLTFSGEVILRSEMNSITPSVSDNTRCYDWNKIQKTSSIFLFDVIMSYMFIRLIDKEVPVICVLLICNIGVVWIMFDTVPLLYTSCLWCFDCKPDRSHENTFNVFIRINLIHREDIGPTICRA